MQFARQLLVDSLKILDDDCPEYLKIGAPGMEVQVDESAFGKRKYNKGHYVNTQWVFGGIEIIYDEHGRDRGGKFFAVVVK